MNEREQEQASLLFRVGGFKSRMIWLSCKRDRYLQDGVDVASCFTS